MLKNVFVNAQSSIKLLKEKVIYFDPYLINEESHDADIIFITHDHYDHYDKDSINKIKNDNTYIVIPKTLKEEVSSYFELDHIRIVEPGSEYSVNGVKFNTIRAYNINKKYHPKENDWVGYKVYLNDGSYYVMGDTDETTESKCVTCDVLFIPIGGTYTMDKEEARHLTNIIGPKIAVPIHYGNVVGSIDDAKYFINNIDRSIEGVIILE